MVKVYISKSKDKDRSCKILNYAYYDLYKKNIDLSKIKKGKYGKPYYDNNFYYNISHSENYICIAISSCEVGIDIEEKNRKIKRDISSKILARNESIIDGNIINNWVIKEAYSKYTGLGFQIGFTNIDASDIIKNKHLINISNNEYICYIYCKEKLEKVEFIEI